MHSEILQVLGKLIKAQSTIASTGKLQALVLHIHHNHKRLVLLTAFLPEPKWVEPGSFLWLWTLLRLPGKNRGRNIERKNKTHTEGQEKLKPEQRNGERASDRCDYFKPRPTRRHELLRPCCETSGCNYPQGESSSVRKHPVYTKADLN